MGVGSGGQEGAVPPRIFKHGTELQISYLFIYFYLCSKTQKKIHTSIGIINRYRLVDRYSNIFRFFFCYFSVFFRWPPSENFSADALVYTGNPRSWYPIGYHSIKNIGYLACLHDQNKSVFLESWLLSSQSAQSERFSKSPDWLEKSRPSKKVTFALIM